MKRDIDARHLFRGFVLSAAALHAWLWLAPVMELGRTPGYGAWLLELDGYGAAIAYHPVLYWSLFASWLLILAGLFFYVAAARFGLLVLVIVSAGLSLGWGIRVLTPMEAALFPLLAVIDGAVLAMAYCPPLRDEFQRGR